MFFIILFFIFFVVLFLFFFFFFFSSRRRHTRSYGDWSSDVCSSDLDSRTSLLESGRSATDPRRARMIRPALGPSKESARPRPAQTQQRTGRSEERRVGKECRCRGWTDH